MYTDLYIFSRLDVNTYSTFDCLSLTRECTNDIATALYFLLKIAKMLSFHQRCNRAVCSACNSVDPKKSVSPDHCPSRCVDVRICVYIFLKIYTCTHTEYSRNSS